MKPLYTFHAGRLFCFAWLLAMFFFTAGVHAQTVLNGDFENTTAVPDAINPDSATFNSLMANANSFGSNANIDIIKTAMYCGVAQHGNWYLAFTGGGSDALALKLSAPLVQGNSYTVSFWDRGCGSWTPYPFEFGLSTNKNSMGTIIYTEPGAPTKTGWVQHVFTFTAPNNGLYLTVDMTAGWYQDWAHMDNIELVTTALPAVSKFQASDTVICQYDCISFTDQSLNSPASWMWSFPGAAVSSSTMQHPANICYLDAGTFPVTLHAANSNGGDTLTVTSYITVSPAPPTPILDLRHDTIFCSYDPSYTSYQWYNDTALMAGQTGSYVVVSADGNYNVKVNNESGCSIAVGINVVLTGLPSKANAGSMVIYPNPTKDNLQLATGNWQNEKGKLQIDIYNVLGQKASSPAPLQSMEKNVVDVSDLPAGVYFLSVRTQDGAVTGRFVKE